MEGETRAGALPRLALAALAALGCHRHATPRRASAAHPTDVPAPATGPRRYDVGGRTLVVELRPDRERFMVSEPTYATMVYSAAGGPVEVELSWMGRNSLGRPENYRLVFRDSRGRALPSPDAGPRMGGTRWRETLRRGHDHRAALLLSSWVSGLAPGRYTLRAETTLRARVPPTRPTRRSQDGAAPRAVEATAWQEVEVAVEAPVEVVADEGAALGGVIEALGRRALGDDADDASAALRQLRVLRDPRVVPVWERLAQYPDYERRYHALSALGAWDDPRALAVLVRATATAASELPAAGYANEALREQSARLLRWTAIHALAASPSPGALAAVLARRDDPDDEVRLTVLHRVARIPGPEAVPLLERYTRDASPTILREARRHLAERQR